jgi:hypothetical protein
MTVLSESGGDLAFRVRQLNRYAEPLPDDYKEQADSEQCAAIAESFHQHILGFVAEHEANVTVGFEPGEPVQVVLTGPEGDELTVSVFGTEAFDVWFSRSEAVQSEAGSLVIGDMWTGVDRSGLVFLTHMFVVEGVINVPDAPDE